MKGLGVLIQKLILLLFFAQKLPNPVMWKHRIRQHCTGFFKGPREEFFLVFFLSLGITFLTSLN